MNLVKIPVTLLDNDRLIHSIKTAIACLIAFLVTKYVYVTADQWIVITTLVVMCAQINVGSMMQKSYMRFLGTLAGAMIAISTIFLFGPNPVINIFVVALSAMLFSFIATSDKSYSESGTLGVVTVAIILVGQNPQIIAGIERFIEICLGILIAATVSQFILPIQAMSHLRRNQSMTIRQLRTFYDTIFSDQHQMGEINQLQNLDEAIVKSLIAQRKLASEAKRESFGKSFHLHQFQESLWLEKEILRSIIFMHHAYHANADTQKIICKISAVLEFHHKISLALEKIAECLEKKRIETIFVPNTAPLKIALSSLTSEQKIYFDGFLFCADILVARLNQLIILL